MKKIKAIRKKFYIIKLQQPAIKAQFSLKLRNNGKTLRMHTKKQLKNYWGTKTMDQLGVLGASRREKTTEEQHRADKVRQD